MRRAAWAVLFAMSTAMPAFAEPPTASELAAARNLFREGVRAAKAGEWERAREAFAKAHALAREPEILLNLAGAQANTAQLLAATETYRRFLQEAPAAMVDANRARVQLLIAEIEERTPRIVIEVAGSTSQDVVELDGAAIASAALGVALPVDPGPHVVALVRGGARAEETVTLAESVERRVRLAIVAPPPPPVVAVVTEPETSSPMWPWLVGAAVVLIAGGVTVGVLASQDDEPYRGTTGVVVRGLRW